MSNEKRARELLAAEYEAARFPGLASLARGREKLGVPSAIDPAIRAVIAALSTSTVQPDIVERVAELEAENERLRETAFFLSQQVGGCEETVCADRQSPNCHCSNRLVNAYRCIMGIEADRARNVS